MNQKKYFPIAILLSMAISAFLIKVFEHYEINLIYYALTCVVLVGVIVFAKNKLEKSDE